jgi:integrase/recombinase XerD
MFDQLFHYPKVIARHRLAPWAAERERYLTARGAQGDRPATLLRLAREILVIAHEIPLPPAASAISMVTISAAAERWANRQRRRGRCRTLGWSRTLFSQVAQDWFRFLGRLQEIKPEPVPGQDLIDDFGQFLRFQRGLSGQTIRNYSWHTRHFLAWLHDQGRPFATSSVRDVDEFLKHQGHGWCRVSSASCAQSLRAFFRHAERVGWCTPGIASAIERPRVFAHEALPTGPDWASIQRLIADTTGHTPAQIRDHVILLLLAVYGFRSGEVAQLRLEDLDWDARLIHLYRSKSRRTQFYPLLPSVGAAIKRYLEQGRTASNRHEIFLTLKAPFRPLSPGCLYHLVSSLLRRLGITSRHRGPHSLRHACATRLVAEGFSLKQIGDHLGHRSAFATRIYAKVDLVGLREVARFDLGGI